MNFHRRVSGSPSKRRFVSPLALGTLVGFVLGSIATYYCVGITGNVFVDTTWESRENCSNTTVGDSDEPPFFLDEVIPKVLRPSYEPDHLQFPVTASMLRQSRPIVGNVKRLHAYLEKLQRGECTSVLFMGGSVTRGHGAGGMSHAYPKFFVQWLNEMYPCHGTDGGKGEHVAKHTNAQNSQTHFISWSLISNLDRIDLAIMEFNVNDAFIPDNPHAIGSTDPATPEYRSGWYNEAILRRLLLLRKPDPVAVVTFNADYKGDPWTKERDEKYRKTLFRDNQEPSKLWLSSLLRYRSSVRPSGCFHWRVSSSVFLTASFTGSSSFYTLGHQLPAGVEEWHDHAIRPAQEHLLVSELAH
ncbi:hypothetical protein ACHAWF_017550 [Thalassiosira exigua]